MSYSSEGGYGAGDMALWVRMPAVFAEDLNCFQHEHGGS